MARKAKQTASAVARATSNVQKVKPRVKAKAKSVAHPRTKTKRSAKTLGVFERLKKLVTE